MKTNKALSIAILSIMVLLGSSFKAAAPAPSTACVPGYTMIEIPDPPTCYALKVYGSGYMFEPLNGPTTSEYTVYSPDYRSIWNLSGMYDVKTHGFSVSVYVKWYSYSSWVCIGGLDWGSATCDTYPMNDYLGYGIDYIFLSKMEFNYGSLEVPDEE